MIFKSIRWRLQIWYGVLLLAVLAGFGFTAYQLQRGKQFQRTDEELQRRLAELGNALRANAPPRERDLQIWCGVLLLAVLAGFGFTAYQLQRGKQFQRTDEELQRQQQN